MDAQQFDDISAELQILHRAMKNIMEMVFAVSPLFVLSTRGWDSRSIHSTFLLRVSDCFIIAWSLFTEYKIFLALGNDRPKVLIKLENSVLEAIIEISKGKATEAVVDTLYGQIESLQTDLENDEKALDWFQLSNSPSSPPLTPAVTALGLTASAGQSFHSNLTVLFI